MFDAFVKITKQEGAPALLLGFAPTAVGYSIQGALKFGGFEFLKHKVVNIVGEETAAKVCNQCYIPYFRSHARMCIAYTHY